jgi:hypothetical protein
LSHDSAWIDCEINNFPLKMMIDSGSDVNTISENSWLQFLEKANEGSLLPSKVVWGNGRRKLLAYAADKPLQIEAT